MLSMISAGNLSCFREQMEKLDTNARTMYCLDFPKTNDDSKVYVVGDIHGCYKQLMNILNHIGFDQNKDFLVTTGDIIDRGTSDANPSNDLDAMTLLLKKWFLSIIGNHEHMLMLQEFAFPKQNGQQWFLDLLEKNHDDIMVIMNRLFGTSEKPLIPSAIRLNEDFSVGVIHATTPYLWDKQGAFHADTQHFFVKESDHIWDRYKMYADYVVPSIDLVVHGHTIVDKPIVRGNRLYLDTGFSMGNLTGVGTLSFFDVKQKRVISITYDFETDSIVEDTDYALNELVVESEKDDSCTEFEERLINFFAGTSQ